ncbi:helix-turn-helix transcriptional regulator [Phycicoccus sp. BSK3Z-2]|uniref:Helix-turn-helix transcriptional regulator n=1 Tax=Phycicoccus avicenniae TaxID=2828860 RepID=A0A941D6T2_9MICO|nr:helix-turn-helix domain-containing protein [Phycicoccus avicenniae]MBR7742753.1 helix-turn-helix transcriptional regulator [Phycicoccus avicenniae]
MRDDGPRSGCAINAAVEAFGDRWTLVVLRDIVFGDRRHFRDLLAGSQEGIASNILADRLKRLVASGLLTKDDAGPGRRSEYRLTADAIDLVPTLAVLGEWGYRHRPTTPGLRARAEVLAEGGPPMWERFMAELRSEHLGGLAPAERPTVRELLARAHAAAD